MVGKNYTFEQIIHRLNFMFRDHNYPEARGIYFVYHGYVDIVDPVKRQCYYSIGVTENFGEAKILKRSSYEYFGDLYAGLEPSVKCKPVAPTDD